MEELRLTFLVFGALAIAGILIHGLWTVRKQRRDNDEPSANIEHKKGPPAEQEPQDSDFQSSSYEQELDELGLGPVRVVSRESREEPVLDSELQDTEVEPEPLTETENDSSVPEPPAFMLKDTPDEPAEQQAVSATDAPAASAPGQAETGSQTQPEPGNDTLCQPEPSATPAPAAEEPAAAQPEPGGAQVGSQQRREPFFGNAPYVDESDQDEGRKVSPEPEPEVKQKKAPSLAERARQGFSRSSNKERKRRTPKVKEDQIAMDFDDQPKDAPRVAESKPAEEVPPEEQEVLVLNVKSPEGKPITGDALLPALLTLGFKFGDQDIFHRHVNSNGKGPVLFSLANMFKPGVFDIDNMEHFSTQGVSLFMILPIDGDPHQVFNMMHNAARKLADEFGAQVLDGRRSALTKQSVQQYVEKIREFERRRIIRRNR